MDLIHREDATAVSQTGIAIPHQTEDSFRYLFASNPLPMWVYDIDSLAFLDVNDAAVDLYGYSRDEFLSMHITDIRPAEDVPFLLKLVKSTKPVRRHSGEWRHRRRDGSLIDVLVTVHALDYQSRAANLVMVQDITERNAAERRLEESEERYRSLFENNFAAIAMTDLDGRFTSVNPTVAQLTGYVPEELTGRSFLLLIPPEEHETVTREFQEVRNGPQQREMEIVRKDGRLVPVYIIALPITVRGEVVGVYLIAPDISERKEAERTNQRLMEQLERERRRLDNLVSSVPGVVWEFWFAPDPEQGRFDYVSPHVKEMFGYTPEQWFSDPGFWTNVVHPDDRRRATEVWKRLRDGLEGVSEFRCVTADGRVIWVETNYAATRDENGAVIGVRGVNMDVTERHEAVEALRQSEERYRLVERATKDVIWDLDLVTDKLRHNEALLEMLDYREEQVGTTGAWWYERTHPDDRDSVVDELFEAIDGDGTAWTGEYRFARGDGTYAFVLDRSYVMRSPEGKPLRVISAMTDLTKHQRVEEELRFLAQASETLSSSLDYHTTLENLSRLLVPFMADYCTIDIFEEGDRVRRLAVAHVDSSKEKMLRKLQARMYAGIHLAHPLIDALRQGKAQFSPDISEEAFLAGSQDKETHQTYRILAPRSYMGVPLHVHGRIIGAISFVTAESGHTYSPADLALAMELARRASVAVDNARLYREIQRADVAKDEFLAMLGHELRNPLGAISNAMQLIHLRGNIDPATRSTLDVVDRQARHMARLVDDLLDVSRITQGKIELRRDVVDLADIVNQAVQTAQPLIDTHEHTLSVSLPEEPIWLEADPIRMAQVFTNLLSNAAKYTDPGGAIQIACEREGNEAVIHVRDNGMGIAEDLLPHVFDLFTQADHSLGRVQGGLGIGLTVARNLVEMHNGRIYAFSNGPGTGSEFVICLPLPVEGALPGAGRDASKGAEPPGALRPLRILLVEDNVDAAKTLAEILEMWGYTVQMAHDGTTALDIASRQHADVVLMDIGLPGMDGYEVARHFREKGLVPDATLVALTGYGQRDDQRRSQEAGFHHHLVKPVDFGTLQGLLTSLQTATLAPK